MATAGKAERGVSARFGGMNYNNSYSRVSPAAKLQTAGSEPTALSLERDARGVHLRLRKAARVASPAAPGSRLQKLAGSIAAFIVCGASATAAPLIVNYDLPGTDYVTTWTNLTSSNSGLAPQSGTGSITVQSPGFAASFGLYSFGGDYGVTLAKSDFTLGVDLKTVILQLDFAPNEEFGPPTSPNAPWNGGPKLSYNGGTQNIPFTYSGVTGTETRNTAGELVYSGWVFQWDLSGITEAVSSYTITAPLAVHSSVAAAQLNASETFAQVVPEPSVAVSLLGGAGLLLGARRRRALTRG